MWLVFIEDCLKMLPESDAFADDVTLSMSCYPNQLKAKAIELSNRLDLLVKWGEIWQVRFATEKTQFMVIWRAPLVVTIRFGNSILANADTIFILGITYDKSLTYHDHILNTSKKAASKLTALRRITWLLGTDGAAVLYKAQIRSAMEFAPLTWGGAAPTHLELLNKVQRRAERLIFGDEADSNLDTLQHRRDVSGMSTMYKIHVLDREALRPLRQAPRAVPRATRAAAADVTRRALQEERSNTLHHQLQFLPRYTKLWNDYVTSATAAEVTTAMRGMQQFKSCVHRWLSTA